jgi:two-component system sensor histidine kinase/response regulator
MLTETIGEPTVGAPHRKDADSRTFVQTKGSDNEDGKEEMLGVLAHFLRNQLGGIRMSAQLISDRAEILNDIRLRRISANILEGSEQMSSFVDQFLANAAADHGFELHLRAVSLAHAAASTIRRYAKVAARKSIKIVGEFPIEGVSVFADNEALEQVIDNLVSNAIKFSPPNRYIWLTISGPFEGMMECRVRDEGPGCDKLDQISMFSRYRRLSAKPTGGEPSTGLGLCIAKRHMDCMHGTLHCESEYGHGATFVLRMPVAVLNPPILA